MEEILRQVPAYLLRPLPAHAEADEVLLDRVAQQCRSLPHSIGQLDATLGEVASTIRYDPAVNLANALVWLQLDGFFSLLDKSGFSQFARYCEHHLPAPALSRCIRRMLIHPDWRSHGVRLLQDSGHWEVSLPRTRHDPWSSAVWRRHPSRPWHNYYRYGGPGRVRRSGIGRQTEVGVPLISDIEGLRELLAVRTPRQLGYFLSATAEPNGPYTKFEIGKRGGAKREISAPCASLMWVQRRILRKILERVAPNEAAHGFVPGRSTVTNARPHVGAELVLKFDLRDFFPTIHQHRVLGLFSSFGYHTGDGRFRTDDRAREVAPVLARLCCVAPAAGRAGVLPQGGPASPAITNLVCRRLDERLTGLARKFGGAYTRYADDLTFSFPEVIQVGRFRWWVDQICQQEGFSVNQQKFHAIRRSQQQQVTGIVVNDRLSVPRRERRRFRAILHNCRTHGIDSQARGNPAFRDYLRGFAAYLRMVDPQGALPLVLEVERLLADEKRL